MWCMLFAALTFPGPRHGGATDIDLVERFRGGDVSAFNEIVRRYQDRIYTLCFRWLGKVQGAEDVSQEIFLALHRSLPGFRGDARLSTWVFKVALNHCRNRRMYRSRRGWGRHDALGPDPDGERRELEIEDPARGQEEAVVANEEARQVIDALSELGDEHRQVLLLRDIEDLPYEEIAEVLGLPEGTVKSRIHRARLELATILRQRLADGGGS